jgi:hypothetical protein
VVSPERKYYYYLSSEFLKLRYFSKIFTKQLILSI